MRGQDPTRTITVAIAALALLTGCRARSVAEDAAFEPPSPVAFPTPFCEPGQTPASVPIYDYQIDLAPGASWTIEVPVTRNGYCGPIELGITGLPPTVHAETAPAVWPANVATIRLQADPVLQDAITLIEVRAWTGHLSAGDLYLRTRSQAAPDWSNEIVGVPGAEGIEEVMWAGSARIFASGAERTIHNESRPVIRCLDLGSGPCPDFGVGGVVPFETAPGWTRVVFDRASDGSFIVAQTDWFSSDETNWWRLTPSGERVELPRIDPIATQTRVIAVALDSEGRILFIAQPKDWSTSEGLYRLNPDGSRDESFSEAGSLAGRGSTAVRVLPDGRIVVGADDFVWLDPDGTPVGPPAYNGALVHEVLDDGRVLYGEYLGPDLNESGVVELVDSSGSIQRHWDLGLHVQPIALSVDGPVPLVVARLNPSGVASGVLRIIALGQEPSLLVERQVGTDVTGAWLSNRDGLRLAGTREFRMPDGEVPWLEAFLWQVE